MTLFLPLRLIFLLLLTSLIVLPCTARAESEPIAYTLDFAGDKLPLQVIVSMTFEMEKPETVQVQMPVWSPGDYSVQNHAKYVQNLQVKQNNAALPVSRPDPNTWKFAAGTGTVTVNYTLETTPPGNFSQNVYFDARQIFLNGPATFLYRVGHKEAACSVKVNAPQGWTAFTSPALKNLKDRFVAPDYDTLADSPFVIARDGYWVKRTFEVEGKPHRILFFGQADLVRFADEYPEVCRRIVTAASKVMGGLRYPGYDFLIDVNGKGGGLEHSCCARVAISAGTHPTEAADFLAHEFFHNWNIKRIRPRVLGPFDYIVPQPTGNIWFAEGVTEYYAHIVCRRASLRSENEFLDHWRGQIARFSRSTAQTRVTAEEASRRVWETRFSQGYGGLSYYQKGELIGLCLDLKIRAVTEGKKSLDDVMRELLKRHSPPNPGYEENGILEVINDITKTDLTAFYTLLTRTTKPLPFAECLAGLGMDTNLDLLPNAAPEQKVMRRDWARVFAK